ncbi:copper resistance CopC family protein [Nonomuraea jabiensis]|uniref:Methionine-rich copper-binding protein CopC n=1 Tax=Nonomuraea jabiensis TaxID=882448 RepID=A0A7W9G914_9ACTN|nr:copper resistance CopC family protein [Nonomuraea jabiensis]MBB5779445.1 methionine-rich copper-binding protein CopC [Nonomuraea jabiensis]
MKRSPLAALAATAAALLVLVFGMAAPALAHDALKSSSPAKDAEVESLDEVRLEFTAGVRLPFVIVRGPGGAELQSGKPEVDGKVVTQAVKEPVPDGKYTIAYRVVSSDGHPIEGEIPFKVKGAETPSPSPTSSESVAPATSAPAASAPAASAPATQPAQSSPATDQASAAQPVSFPVWLVIVIGALVGIGIGFLLSARKKKP